MLDLLQTPQIFWSSNLHIHGRSYEFGNWMSEFMYEYRKDVFDYIWILVIIYAYRFIVSRLRGEAHVISTGVYACKAEMNLTCHAAIVSGSGIF